MENSESYHSAHKNPIFCQILRDACLQVCVTQKQRPSEKYVCVQHNSLCIGGSIVVCVCEQCGEHSRFVKQLSAGQKHLSETHAYRLIMQTAHSINSIAHILHMLHWTCSSSAYILYILAAGIC